MNRTPLASRHEALGARMVDFAGWYMPVQYTGIIDEHRAVRTNAGLFDLGHMGQVDVAGPDALAYVQYVASNDAAILAPGEAQYSLLLYPDGGVVDDIIVYRRPSGVGFFIVINAANAAKDLEWLRERREERSDLDVTVRDISDVTGMIALQGPRAAEIVAPIVSVELGSMSYFTSRETIVGTDPLSRRPYGIYRRRRLGVLLPNRGDRRTLGRIDARW